VILAAEQRKFQGGRDKHEAARRDAAGLLQRARDGHGAKAAIAFTGQEHGRGHARAVGQIEANEISERLGVLLDTKEVALALAFGRAAIASAYRVNTHA